MKNQSYLKKIPTNQIKKEEATVMNSRIVCYILIPLNPGDSCNNCHCCY